MNFYNVSTIVRYILDNYQGYDQINVMYNEYINIISFKTKTMEIMSEKEFDARFTRLSTYDVDEPEADVASPYFYEFYVASQFYHALL